MDMPSEIRTGYLPNTYREYNYIKDIERVVEIEM
jgi:hypothetical protein